MLSVKQFEFNHFGVNCYLVFDEVSKQCAVVDPAMETGSEDAKLFQYIDEHKLTPRYILLTHAHVDHVCGLRQACKRFDLPVSMHCDGMRLLRQAAAYGSIMGFDTEPLDDLPTTPLEDGTQLALGDDIIECRYVPGHCPGSICFYLPSAEMVMTGDALFCQSIGRTDLPGGDYQQLIAKLKERIMTLDDRCLVLPGHGETSTVGDERKWNTFLV